VTSGHADAATTALYPAERLRLAADATGAAGLGALLLTPGPDLRYVTGYDAHQLERLTCLALPADGDPFLVVPRLELPAAQASPAGAFSLEMIPWDETDDPYELVARRLGPVSSVGLSDRMWAMMVLRFRAALPAARQGLASAALRRAGGAAPGGPPPPIDRVHAALPGWLRPGRTELEVAADVAAAISDEGHARTDFVIIASGPNAASPHHEPSGRVLRPGDAVVVDIGGTMPSGYCSDCTRVYAVGSPPAEFTAYYEVLRDAQEAACAAVRPGVTAEAVDAAARAPITAAGYGPKFVHRTGHGIGLETHEDPYIVAGNAEPLAPGMAFSVEPGIYPGPHGARIEDIVVCTEQGYERLNHVTRELVVVGGA
jgi:Xaa-Pro aminopeptidase